MSIITILTEDEKLAYDYPPILTAEARALCFVITPELESKLNRLRTPANKIGFLLQYGYFKVCKRFFVANRFRQEDIDYLARILGIPDNEVNLADYKKKMPIVHQDAILKLLEYKPLGTDGFDWLACELQRHVKRLVEPRKLFFTALNLLHDRKIALPSYHLLAELIGKYYCSYEDNLLQIVKANVTEPQKEILKSFLEKDDNSGQWKLNQFKHINQSLKAKSIQASIGVFSQIEEAFNVVLPLIELLALTPESCEYYATWVKKSKLSQLKQFPDPNRLFLHLIAFCQHQYYLRQDAFVDIFMKSVQTVKNSATIKINKVEQLTRKDRKSAIRYVTQKNRSYRELIDDITDIVKSPLLTDSGKLIEITELLAKHQQQKSDEALAKAELFEKSLDKMANDSDYLDVLEKLSLKLQKRVSGIIKILTFNEDNSDKNLLTALNHYKEKDGKIDHNGVLRVSPENVTADKRYVTILHNMKKSFDL